MSAKKYKIAYIILYFGNLPNTFPLFLKSCRFNPTIDWYIFTDDERDFDYPPNVKVTYISFADMVKYMQRSYDFEIKIEYPYKLCDFKPAYGEIFVEYLQEYDFWGHCDLDIIWGDIRRFITDDILSTYDKIGFQGHSTLYRNTYDNNRIYRVSIEEIADYKTVFSSSEHYAFDEKPITEYYNVLGIEQYTEVIFAHPSALHYNIYLKYLPAEDEYKNKYQVLEWNKGRLFRVYYSDKAIGRDEFMYYHIFKRKMKTDDNIDDRFLILHHSIRCFKRIDGKYLKQHNKNNMFLYYLEFICGNMKKLRIGNIKHIIYAFKQRWRIKKELKDRIK